MEFFVAQYKRSDSLRLCCFSTTSQSQSRSYSIELSNPTARQPTKRGSKRRANKNEIPDVNLAQYERADMQVEIRFDITCNTGLDHKQVGLLLKDIVNLTCYQQKTGIVYLRIGPKPDKPGKFQKKYKLTPIPTTDQPGNGILSIRKPDSGWFIGRAYGKAMTDDLEKSYNGDTRAFATHLEKLFEDNTSIGQFPFVTSEVYMLLLFEIARRQVKDSDESTDKK